MHEHNCIIPQCLVFACVLCDSDSKHSYVGTLVIFIVICAILYFVYSQFLSGTRRAGDAPPPYSADPSPPGFRPEYMPPPSGDNSVIMF